MSLAIRMGCEALRRLAFGSISGTYAGIGAILAHPSRIMEVWNTTDTLLAFSFDGIDDHFILPTNSAKVLDICTNQTLTQGLFLAQGSRLYVRTETGAVDPTSGSVYFTSYYAINGLGGF